MKKSLVLAMAMALGVTASAYAANPFSDVPAGHWAYDSISKLAAAGVIEGYGDDTFRGDRLMTRYEMAQIVAKAMAKGANVDKLAAEFADELDALGVRVAALEKKSDNVKITGYFRYDYARQKVQGNPAGGTNGDRSRLRTRIWFNGKVNDTWNYVGMIQNDQDLKDNVENPATNFQRTYLEGRLGGLKTVAGRYNKNLLGDNAIFNSRMDGIDFTYGKKVKFNAFYGIPTDQLAGAANGNRAARFDKVWGASLIGSFGDLGARADYVRMWDPDDNSSNDDNIFAVGLKYNFKGGFGLGATYVRTSYDYAVPNAKKNGFFATANYKGAKANKVGSWGLGVHYYYMPAGAVIESGWDTTTIYNQGMNEEGYKGWFAKANYTVAKNMILGVQYWDFKSRVDNDKNKTLWGDLVVTF